VGSREGITKLGRKNVGRFLRKTTHQKGIRGGRVAIPCMHKISKEREGKHGAVGKQRPKT